MKKVLYLGLTPPSNNQERDIIHYPVIDVVPEDSTLSSIQDALNEMSLYTHLIFTSKSAVTFFFHLCDAERIQDKQIIAVGKATAAKLKEYHVEASHVADKEQAEGVVEILETIDLRNANLFWPRSSLARSVIPDYLSQHGIKYRDTAIYTTVNTAPTPIPTLDDIDEIMFTSPSTVDGFLAIFGVLPQDKTLSCIGPVTRKKLEGVLSR